MKIAVASGKGGTGKTTVATNLARVAARSGRTAAYLDCDVEEPNGHIFLKPRLDEPRPVGTLIPMVDLDACTRCGKCGEICQFSGIAVAGENVLVFEDLCHGCGGCAWVCPTKAIREVVYETGVVRTGSAGDVAFVDGLLHVGKAISPPVIHAVQQAAPSADLVIVDAPPGTSCPVIESVRGCDLLLLVTEPTPFGLNDLKLAVDMAGQLGLASAVVINRAGTGDDGVVKYCREAGVEVLAEIPDDRRIAEAYSRGELACDASKEFARMFESLLDAVLSKEARS